MAKSTKVIQLYRNAQPVNDITAILGNGNDIVGKWKEPTFLATLKDGEQLIARYKTKDATPNAQDEIRTIYGVAHIVDDLTTTSTKNYIEVFYGLRQMTEAIRSKVEGEINLLDSNIKETDNTVISGVTITNGKITANNKRTLKVNEQPLKGTGSELSVTIGGAHILTGDVSSTDKTDVTSGNSLNLAIAKLQNKIKAVDGKAGVKSFKATTNDGITLTPTTASSGDVTLTATLSFGTVASSNTTKAVNGQTVASYVSSELANLSAPEQCDPNKQYFLTQLKQDKGKVTYKVAEYVAPTIDYPVDGVNTTTTAGSIVTGLTLDSKKVKPTLTIIKVNGKAFSLDTAKTTLSTTIDGGDIVLTGYTQGNDDTDVDAGDTVNEAFAKLQNQVTALDTAAVKSVTGDTNTFISVLTDPTTGAVKINPSLTFGTFGADGKGTVTSVVPQVDGVATVSNTAKHVEDAIAHLDKLNTLSPTGNKYITGLSQTDGIIDYSTTKLLADRPTDPDQPVVGIVTDISLVNGTITPTYVNTKINGLSLTDGQDHVFDGSTIELDNYVKGALASDIKPADTVNLALSKLENRIDNVGKKAGVTSFTGSVASSSTNYLGVTQTGKQTGDAALTISAKIGTYTNKNSATAGLVNTDVLKKAIQGVNGSNVGVEGYTKPKAPVTAISDADSINVALGKLEGKLDSITLTKLSIANPNTSTNIAEYALHVNGDKTGDVIQIPKDRTLDKVEVTDHTATGYIPGSAAGNGTFTYAQQNNKKSLSFAYIMADGSYSVASIAIDTFFTQATYGNGLIVDEDNKVSVRIDSNNPIKFKAGTEGQRELIYQITATNAQTNQDTKYVSSVSQDSTGKITVVQTDLPIKGVTKGDGVTVGTGKTPTISVNRDNKSIILNQDNLEVGTVDCGTY